MQAGAQPRTRRQAPLSREAMTSRKFAAGGPVSPHHLSSDAEGATLTPRGRVVNGRPTNPIQQTGTTPRNPGQAVRSRRDGGLPTEVGVELAFVSQHEQPPDP